MATSLQSPVTPLLGDVKRSELSVSVHWGDHFGNNLVSLGQNENAYAP